MSFDFSVHFTESNAIVFYKAAAANQGRSARLGVSHQFDNSARFHSSYITALSKIRQREAYSIAHISCQPVPSLILFSEILQLMSPGNVGRMAAL